MYVFIQKAQIFFLPFVASMLIPFAAGALTLFRSSLLFWGAASDGHFLLLVTAERKLFDYSVA